MPVTSERALYLLACANSPRFGISSWVDRSGALYFLSRATKANPAMAAREGHCPTQWGGNETLCSALPLACAISCPGRAGRGQSLWA
jgi:hypothetical protein